MYNNSLSVPEQVILYSLLAANLSCILFYIFVLLGILKQYKAFGIIYLQFIVVVAFQDLTVLITPIFAYFPDPGAIPTPIALLIAVLFYVSLLSELLVHTVIALNRFVAIVFMQHYKSIFTIRFSRCSIAACFIVTILCIPLTPSVSGIVNKTINVVCWLLTILLYTIAGIVSVKRVKKSLTYQRNNSDFRRELKLLLQAGLTTMVMSVVLISQLLPACNSFGCTVRTYIFVLVYGLCTPVSYLIVDKTLLANAKRFFCWRSKVEDRFNDKNTVSTETTVSRLTRTTNIG